MHPNNIATQKLATLPLSKSEYKQRLHRRSGCKIIRVTQPPVWTLVSHNCNEDGLSEIV
jgi:hypothetical protein